MKKNYYTSPKIEAVKLSTEDILNGSDVLVDGSDLFGPQDDEQ